ncbi:MAG: hypothetical protein ACPGYT_09070 [Nitrospirales bacterium]
MKPERSMITTVSLTLGMCLFMGGLANAEVSLPSAINLHQALHFQSPKGDPIEVKPGMYDVQAQNDQLQLHPTKSDHASPIVIQSHEATHEEPVDGEYAYLMPSPEGHADSQHVLLFQPGGSAYEAVGSKSGVFTRGGSDNKSSKGSFLSYLKKFPGKLAVGMTKGVSQVTSKLVKKKDSRTRVIKSPYWIKKHSMRAMKKMKQQRERKERLQKKILKAARRLR